MSDKIINTDSTSEEGEVIEFDDEYNEYEDSEPIHYTVPKKEKTIEKIKKTKKPKQYQQYKCQANVVEHNKNSIVQLCEDALKKINPYSKKEEDLYAILDIKDSKDNSANKAKINNFIQRAEKCLAQKIEKIKKKREELDNKIKQDSRFKAREILKKKKENPQIRTAEMFYNDQINFYKTVNDKVENLKKQKLEEENKNKNIKLTCPKSEEIAAQKFPNETREDMCKRLANEKLKKAAIVNNEPKKQEKTYSKEEIAARCEKLWKDYKKYEEDKNQLAQKIEKQQQDKINETRVKKCNYKHKKKEI